MSFRSAVVIGITATMAVAIAACGDDGDGAEDFIAEADQICTDAERETVGAIAEHGPIQSASDEAELLTDVVPIGEQTLESLRGLEAPDDVSSQFEDYLAQREVVLALVRERLEAAEADGTAEESQRLSAEADEARDQANEIGAEIGFEACAEQLPTEDVDQITADTERFFTSEDPSVCEELMTEEFIEFQFGGSIEECERQQQVEAGTKAVEISEVEGVAGVTATAEAVPQGGPSGGQQLTVAYEYEDGTYKVAEVAQAAPSP